MRPNGSPLGQKQRAPGGPQQGQFQECGRAGQEVGVSCVHDFGRGIHSARSVFSFTLKTWLTVAHPLYILCISI